MNTVAVTVHALSPELLPDFLRFFDGTAFSDNPKWSSCYCQCFYEDHSVVKWSDRTAPQNRALACKRIQGQSMQGFLAYSDESPVGWCNAAPAVSQTRIVVPPEVVLEGVAVNDRIFTDVITVRVVLAETVPFALEAVMV